jgi:hypothetical protein
MEEIVRAKPSSAKGRYVRSATLTTTMGPGIRVDAGKAGDTSDARPVPSRAAAEESPAAPGSEAEAPADDSSEEQSQSDSSATSENTEEAATA